MAYFSEDELIDSIRHIFIAEDDTGVCEATLLSPVKRQKPGGLPLNFRIDTASLSFDGADDSLDWLSSSPEIRADGPSRMRTYTMKQMELMQKAKKKSELRSIPWKTPPAELLRAVPPPFDQLPIVKPTTYESVTSQLVAESPLLIENPFLEYAKFEAARTDRMPSQSFLIFYPMSDEPSPIRVLVRSTARVADLIGLCCFKYAYVGRQPPLKTDPTLYQLLMADETGDIETDLPPLPPKDYISRLGFPAFALVERPVTKFEQKAREMVVVYMTSGKKYQFELESLDVTIEWLRDQVLEQRMVQCEDTDNKSHRRNLNEYVIENLHVRDVCLPMDSTIAQADTTEFIMLRKNSSRGDFLTPMQKRMTLKDLELTLPSGQQQQLAVPSPTTPVLLLGRSPKFPWNRKQQSSICSTDGGANKDEFNVYRIHKYKPKWPAKLAFKQDTIEVLPSSGDRKNSIFKQTYKQTVIALESIGGAEIAEERPFGKKLVRISYQPMDGKHEWKTLQLEAELDDTWQIVSKVNDQIDANKSPARLAYLSRTPTKKLSSFLQFASSSPRLLPRRSSEISPTAKKSPQTAAFGNR